MHSVVSFQRCYSPNDSAAGRSLGAWLVSMATPSHGILHTTRSLCINGGIIDHPPRRGERNSLTPRRPNPKIGLPYTYLIAWFALHCPVIIQPWEKPPEGVRWRTFVGSKGPHGNEFMWLRSINYCVATTYIASFDVSLTFETLVMAKSSRMPEMVGHR